MAVLTDIRSTNWQLSLQGAGFVEEGLADIRQCIDVILRTVKGTVPLQPQFGSDIYQYIDKPVSTCVPNVKKCIIEALTIWEPRVSIVRITHKIIEQQIQFFITYGLVNEEATDQVQLFLKNNDVIVNDAPAQSLILQGDIPAVYQQLKISLVLDGNEQLPTPPAYGFSTPAAMLSWATANWGWIGRWYLLPGKIMLFVNAGLAITGSITITSLAIKKYIYDIPDLLAGQTYSSVIKNPAGDELQTFTSDNISDILTLLQGTYGQYGNWEVENIKTGLGDFNSNDFNELDFLTIGSYYQFVLYTTDDPGASVETVAV